MQPPNRRASRRHKPKRSTKAACLKGALGLGRNIALSVLDVSETGACLTVKDAGGLRDEGRLAEVRRLAREQGDWIDAHAPQHRLSSPSAASRATSNTPRTC